MGEVVRWGAERCAGLSQREAGREHGTGRVFAVPASPRFLAGSRENRKHEEGLYLRETKIKKRKQEKTYCMHLSIHVSLLFSTKASSL